MLEDRKIYVTMTTLPKRDKEVGYCLDSIFNQTYKNIEVIMYLNDWEYPDHILPDSIADVTDKRFRIVWLTHDDYKGDLRAWKSVIPFLKEHVHEDNILWYQSDDDWVYYPEMLQDLLTSLGNDKYAISTNSGYVTIFR